MENSNGRDGKRIYSVTAAATDPVHHAVESTDDAARSGVGSVRARRAMRHDGQQGWHQYRRCLVDVGVGDVLA